MLVGDNGTTDPVALAAFARHPVRRIEMPEPFHFASFNNRLVREAKGEYLLFLNNDTEILQTDWIARMRLHASQPGVGAVGALLTYPDGTVQHAGVVLGPRGTADHLFRHFRAISDFYHGIIGCDREVSVVTAACLLVSADKFREIGVSMNGSATTTRTSTSACASAARASPTATPARSSWSITNRKRGEPTTTTPTGCSCSIDGRR